MRKTTSTHVWHGCNHHCAHSNHYCAHILDCMITITLESVNIHIHVCLPLLEIAAPEGQPIVYLFDYILFDKIDYGQT